MGCTFSCYVYCSIHTTQLSRIPFWFRIVFLELKVQLTAMATRSSQWFADAEDGGSESDQDREDLQGEAEDLMNQASDCKERVTDLTGRWSEV